MLLLLMFTTSHEGAELKDLEPKAVVYEKKCSILS